MEGFCDIPLLEQTPEEQERQPDLGPEGNEKTYLRPAALAAYKTTIEETGRIKKDIFQTQWMDHPVLAGDQSVLYYIPWRSMHVYILRGHVRVGSPDRLAGVFYKTLHPIVKTIKELESFDEEQLRVVEWETSPDHFPGALFARFKGYKEQRGISVICKQSTSTTTTHRFIPSHRHQVNQPTIRDGFVSLDAVKTGDNLSTVTLTFGLPECLDDFWMSKLQLFLPHLEQTFDK